VNIIFDNHVLCDIGAGGLAWRSLDFCELTVLASDEDCRATASLGQAAQRHSGKGIRSVRGS
jgi:hypothetical protein